MGAPALTRLPLGKMRWKTTLVLILAVLGIGAYISLVEIRQPTARQRQAANDVVLDLPPEAVIRLAIELPEIRITLARTIGGWTIVPQGFRADPALVEDLLAQLTPLTADRRFSGTPNHPLAASTYGLDPAVGRLTLVTGNTAATLLIGETTPVRADRYVAVAGRPDIFVVPAALFDAVNHPLQLFRDPHLIPMDGWLVDALAADGARPFALVRNPQGWAFIRPVADRADATAVQTLLQRLSRLRIQRFVEETAPGAQPTVWGFDHPTAELRLRRRDTADDLRLTFGASLAQTPGLLYAKRSDESALYAVSAADVQALLADPNTLRARTCFDATAAQIRQVEVTWAGTRWGMERSGTTWTVRGSGAVLDASAVERFLVLLTTLRLDGFVDEPSADLARYGLAPPAGTVTVSVNGKEEPERLLVGAALETSQQHYGRIDGRPAVVQLPPAVAELLAMTPQQLANPAVSATAPGSAPAPAPSAATR